MITLSAQEQIKMARIEGHDAGEQYIKRFGIEAAREYVKQLCEQNQQPSNQMFGHIDGFMNAVVEW